jgi:acyl transferase domain-containing protein/thioesterase domain-containing protein
MSISETSGFPPSTIAVVGMAGRFPGARTVAEFWRNLQSGTESITDFTDDQLRASGVDEVTIGSEHYVRRGAVLDDMEMFDAGFFGFSPKDAAIMDPQHRHFLECSWEALENAGYDPARFGRPIGVFAGSGMNAYMMYNLLRNRHLMSSVGLFLVRHTGNDKDFLSTRVSYLLDLRGPSLNVQTACSTSLVAIHLACQSLLHGECDLALAGGVTIELPHRQGYMFREGEILARDGRCRAFDAASTGTVFGSGVGVVALRRLEDALADGDHIHAVIRGTAINNDGSSKVGYLAPSVDGQVEAIAEALAVAEVDPDSISYVEAHGTGTAVGDPIEVAALTQAFREATGRGYCGLGSVKSNIGHLDTAAGVASFIKVIEALKHRQMPPTLHFQRANPLIDFARSPFFVVDRLREWPRNGHPRRAGVSSLGVGGTNAHVVLEEAPDLPPSAPRAPWQLLTLSARTPAALDAAARNLAAHLDAHPELDLADVAHTCQTGRRAFKHRRVVAVRDLADAATVLREGDSKRVFSHVASDRDPSVVFLFPGGGAQYPGMGRELYAHQPEYRRQVDECLERLRRFTQANVRDVLFPAPERLDAAARELERPSLALPALFITEYALAKLWMSWGVTPAALAGHSLGEYTAACLSGVITLDDALALVTLRGELFEQLPDGGMLSVPLPEAEARECLDEGLSIAAVNGDALCVVSGDSEALARFQARVAGREIECQRLKISVAAHSHMLEPILDAFAARVARVRMQAPRVPFTSNVTGGWFTERDAADPTYWVRHIRQTVRFADNLQTLLAEPSRSLIEVGPGQTLVSLARMHSSRQPTHTALSSLRHPQDATSDLQFTQTTLGRLWAAGTTIDWTLVRTDGPRRRVPLPTYPFERQRFWIDADKDTAAAAADAFAKSADIGDWFYEPFWKETVPTPLPESAAGSETWLVFTDRGGFGGELADRVAARGQHVVRVAAGGHFTRISNVRYEVNPAERADFDALVENLTAGGKKPTHILFCWPLEAADLDLHDRTTLDRRLQQCFYSLLYLSQALAQNEAPVRLTILTNGMQAVGGDRVRHPEASLVLGPARVIPRELPAVACVAVDLPMPARGGWLRRESGFDPALVDQVLADAVCGADAVVAYRHGARWVEAHDRVQLKAPADNRTALRDQGVYLITGGTGGLGLVHAEYLARTVRARLVLVGRTALPARDQWDQWLAAHADTDRVAGIIRQVRRLEELGSEVMVAAADVSSADALTAVVNDARRRFGAIHGVLHAAGALDDGLIPLKTARAAADVLAPKVQGTLALDAAVRDCALDFFVLFSSTSAVLGPAGQVDYTAANAFLNAFARWRPGRTVAVDWGVWKDVGMAAAGSAGRTARNAEVLAPAAVSHPLLQTCVANTPDHVEFSAEYETSHWFLADHRLKSGPAVLPGTAYVEIARAAMAHVAPGRAVEIGEIFMVAPMDFATTARRRVRVVLTRSEDGYDFAVSSADGAGGAAFVEHARGRVSARQAAPPPALALADVRERCGARVVECAPDHRTRQEQHLDFGDRWRTLRRLMFGADEALADIEIDARFAGDLEQFGLHPAMLDMATGFGLPLLEGYGDDHGLYVPLSYRSVVVHGALPSRFVSHVRRLGPSHRGVASFAITLAGEDGRRLVEIEEFLMRRLDGAAAFAEPGGAHQAQTSGAERGRHEAAPAPGRQDARLAEWIARGILATEGTAAFERVLANGSHRQLVVTSIPLPALAARLAADAASDTDAAESSLKLARPEMAEAFVAPEGDAEKTVAAMFQEILGIDQVGATDSFFDLGGHSLLALRLFAKIKSKFGKNLPLGTLFDAPTVRHLAALLRDGQKPAAFKCLVAIQPNGSKPPLFIIHGMGGNIVEYQHLQRYLGPEQPVYGIQARGLDGHTPFLRRVPELAAHYIKEIRALQPAGPYYLAGSSFGGLVGYEIAQQLLEHGERVALLALFDTYGKDYPKPLPTTTAFRRGLNRQILRFQLHSSNLRLLHGADRLVYIREKASKIPRMLRQDARRRYKAVRRQIRLLMLPKALRVQFKLTGEDASGVKIRSVPKEIRQAQESTTEAARMYEPQPYDGPVTLFRATNQPAGIYPDPTNGWGSIVKGQLRIIDIPGHHGAIIREPRVAHLAEKLIQCLDEAHAAQDGRRPASAQGAAALGLQLMHRTTL